MNSRIENVAPSIQITVNLLRKLSVSGAPGPAGSMSSIKRDVKKKVLLRPEARCFLEIQPAVVRLPWRSVTCTHSDESPLVS